MSNNVMLDLETFSTEPNAAIVAIGLVRFDAHQVVDAYYSRVNANSQIKKGAHVSHDTISWWLSQSDAARDEISKAQTCIEDILPDISKFIRYDDRVWSNGADFDIVILREAFKRHKHRLPFRFFNGRCYRTLKGLAPNVTLPRDDSDISHNALGDAMYQAKHLQKICSELGIEL